METGEPVLGDTGMLAVEEGDLPVPTAVNMADERFHTTDVVAKDSQAIVEDVVNGYQGDGTGNKLPNPGVVKVDTGDDHAVHTPV